jgi:Ca2+-transporting ATPase
MSSPFLWHTQEVDSVAYELKTDLEQGLSNKEAASRLAAYGPNELSVPEHLSWVKVFTRQNISLMIPVLALASVILFRTGRTSTAVLVICVSIVSIILSSLQEIRSETLLRYFRKLASKSIHARVLRSGHIDLVKATDLAPGDIICFEAGDQIPADGRLIEAKHLAVDESVFLETTEPTEKGVNVVSEDIMPLHPIQQRRNMIFMGTSVVSGSGRAIIIATGMQTQIAQVSLSQTEESEVDQSSTLEARLMKKGLWVAVGCIAFSVLLWIAAKFLVNMSTLDGAVVGMSFLIAAWPMGLIDAVSMALTTGMKKLTKNQIVIRQPSGMEALASVTALCSEKTGIMTQNLMTVKKVFVDGRIISVEGDGYDPESGGFPPNAEEDNPDLPLLLTAASVCTDTEVKNTTEGWSVMGDATEGALIVAAMKGGVSKDELGLTLEKLAELPFDPERKRMSVVFRAPNDEMFLFTRGSLETVMDICSNIQLYGYVEDLDIGKQHAIWAVDQSFARERMLSLAFAYRKLEEEPENYTVETIERDLVFVGMMGIADPLRADVKPAVSKCLDGGVETIMLTGDHTSTAFAFAQALDIARDVSETLSGEDLDIMGEKEYSSSAEKFSVYADVSPDQKLRIVRTLRDKDEVIAVIGKDAGDVPAIEEADVGIAAGQNGSSATINASDVVIMDSSFATAVNAIETMRGAYGNARKIARYFLSGGAATAFTILIALIIRIFWRNSPFPPLSFLHVLWINLLGVSISAIAIIFNPLTDGAMKEGPYPRGSIFDSRAKSEMVIRTLVATAFALIAFAFSLGYQKSLWVNNQSRAITAVLTVLIMSQLAFAFQRRRTPDESFSSRFLKNKLLLILTSLVILIHLSVIYVPRINQIFGMKPLSLVDWIPVLAAFVICLLPLDELFSNRAGKEGSDLAVEGINDELTEKDNGESIAPEEIVDQ